MSKGVIHTARTRSSCAQTGGVSRLLGWTVAHAFGLLLGAVRLHPASARTVDGVTI